ncbi:hypothetical protein [Xanthobacter aminoxidans]|uniref:Uncharacterized protein n=1 Tax=Xanthobacter aminoxidans TaxID=186280 RepID=A0ABW6Z9X8_9HYPH
MKEPRPAMTPDELQRNVSRIADAAEKLLFETERLRRDVARLAGRIEPFEGEPQIPEPPPFVTPLFTKKSDLRDAVIVIDTARKFIVACEHELSAIRGRMDAIEADAISRDEMKPWLKK